MDKALEMRILHGDWKDCSRCELSKRRVSKDTHKLVFGDGDPDTELMFVGEGPGKSEEEVGRPFVGASGLILDALFNEYGINRDSIYITNAISCRSCAIFDKQFEDGKKTKTEKDVPPPKTAIEACRERLLEQIYIVNPAVIVLLGSVALKAVAGPEYKLKEWLGECLTITIPGRTKLGDEKRKLTYTAISTWHPSFLIRTNSIYNDSPDSIAVQFARHIQKAIELIKSYKTLIT